jgi:hypothetical protein
VGFTVIPWSTARFPVFAFEAQCPLGYPDQPRERLDEEHRKKYFNDPVLWTQERMDSRIRLEVQCPLRYADPGAVMRPRWSWTRVYRPSSWTPTITVCLVSRVEISKIGSVWITKAGTRKRLEQ